MDASSNGYDAELVRQVGRGSRSALERIYREHKDRLAGAAYHLLGDRASAEDVLQDVFVTFARRAERIRLQSGLQGYLLASCLNRARDVLRRRSREPASDERLDARRNGDPGPDAAASKTDEARRVSRALATLPDRQREVVVLRFYGQLKFREIADVLGVSINTAQSRHRYALAALRKRLGAGEAR